MLSQVKMQTLLQQQMHTQMEIHIEFFKKNISCIKDIITTIS